MPSKPKPLPPLELLETLFSVSATSPSGLIWKVQRSNNIKVGQVAGRKDYRGYWAVNITTDKTRLYKTHRIVYYLETKIDPGLLHIDHVNGVKDNIKLRVATSQQNGANRKKQNLYKNKSCSSCYKGVSWHKRDQKWCAQIMINQKAKYLGYFDSELEAALAYNNEALKYFGEYAQLNILIENQ